MQKGLSDSKTHECVYCCCCCFLSEFSALVPVSCFIYYHTCSGSVHLSCKFTKIFYFFSDFTTDWAVLLRSTGYLFWGCVLLLLLGLQERVPDSPSPAPSLEDHRRPGSHPSSHRSSSVSSSPAHTESSSDRIRASPHTADTHFLLHHFVCLWAVVETLPPSSIQPHITTACPWTTPCSASHPTSPPGLKRETWPTTWATKQQRTKGITPTKVSHSPLQVRVFSSCVSIATRVAQNRSHTIKSWKWEHLNFKVKRSWDVLIQRWTAKCSHLYYVNCSVGGHIFSFLQMEICYCARAKEQTQYFWSRCQ